ncbi:unnamed protein product, partial [Discosporangium mesarthrocarpum]
MGGFDAGETMTFSWLEVLHVALSDVALREPMLRRAVPTGRVLWAALRKECGDLGGHQGTCHVSETEAEDDNAGAPLSSPERLIQEEFELCRK